MRPPESEPAAALEAALQRDDLAAAAEIVGANLWPLVQSHFGLLQQVLDRLPSEVIAENPALALVKGFGGSVFVESGAVNQEVEPVMHGEVSDPAAMPDQVFDAILLQEMLAHRLHGDLAAAVGVGARLRERSERADAQGRRPVHPLAAFYLLHVGITESLAGDFDQALRDFSEARILRHPSGPEVTDRDLQLKSAAVLAALGRLVEAERLLAEAEAMPPLGEPFASQLLGTELAARAIIAVDRLDPTAPALVAEALASNADAETWPFALLASTRWAIVTGDLLGAIDQAEQASALRPVPKDSFAEAVVVAARAEALTLLGDVGGAARVLDEAAGAALGDAEVVRVRITLSTEGLGAAITAARSLAFRSGLGPTARAETMLLKAWAQRRLLGSADATTSNALGALIAREGLWRLLHLVPSDVSADIPSLDGGPVVARRLEVREPDPGAQLTPNELEILRLLAGPDSLPEISRIRFVTLNTIKSQVASVYRRLDVHSRREAVAEAVRRGILGRPSD
jgi:LuxR family maltose regulon positive regulatory protein